VLVAGLERYRALSGGPVVVISGYRDPRHNAAVGGAPGSQHLYGNAADLRPRVALAAVRRLGVFSGIGYQAGSGLVRHVDVRHVGPNPTHSTPRDPAVWPYG